MNKQGNIYLGVVLGLFLFIMGVLFIPFITDDITTARDAMECSSTTITGGNMLTCMIFSSLTPYFIWFFCSLLVGYFLGATK